MRLLLIASLAALGVQASSIDSHAQDLTEAQALEEAELLYTAIVERHPNPFWFNDEEHWQAEMAHLRTRRGPVTHVEQYFDLSRLMALATDTHVQIYPGEDTPGFETSYPIRFRLFEEGIYIIAANGTYRDWVGARVVSIYGLSAEEIVDALDDYSFSDHPSRKRTYAVSYQLRHPSTFRYFGWTNDRGGVDVELELLDGTHMRGEMFETVDMSHDEVGSSDATAGYYWPEGWRTLDDIIPGEPPVSRQNLDRNYWYTELEGGRVLYFQFNSPSNEVDGQSIYDFTLEMFAHIGALETPPEQVIVDARYNLGGWIHYTLPFGYLLQTSDACCRRGTIVLLTGRETISAGSVFAGVFEQSTRAIVIGEPTGGRPNIFLGHQPVELPYSGLRPEISTETYVGTDSADDRMFVAPDVLVPESFAAIMTGGDPAFEAARNLTREEALSFYPGATADTPWTRPSQVSARQQVPH